MPPKLDPDGSGFSALLTSVFVPPDQRVDEDKAQQFENKLSDDAVYTDIQSNVCLRITIYKKIGYNGSTLTEYIWKKFPSINEDMFPCMNDPCRKFRDYFCDREAFTFEKRHMIFYQCISSCCEKKINLARFRNRPS